MDERAWEDLLEFMDDGEVIPVLGSELLLSSFEGRPVTLQRLLAEQLAAEEKLDVAWRPHSELNDAVCAYLEKPGTRPTDLYPRITRMLRKLSPRFPLPEALLKLAQIRALNLFASVTFDSLMARALDQVRHQGNPFTREISFSLNQSTEQGEVLRARPAEAPVVVNLFGKASSAADYVIHDEDALELIHGLVSGKVAPPEWLLSTLRDAHLLILGVHLPDWLGRFVLRAATRGRLLLTPRTYFIAAQAVPEGGTLAEFLRRFGRETRIHVYEGGAAEFVDELHRRSAERAPSVAQGSAAAPASPDSRRGSIFISYGRENLDAVEALHRSIVSMGGDAWFDREALSPGDRWEQKILPRIQRDAKLFIPVLSGQTAARGEGYVFREWREAIERSKTIVARNFIVPVVVDPDYQSGKLERYERILDAFPALRGFQFGWAPGGQPDEKLRSVLVSEIRNLHREEQR